MFGRVLFPFGMVPFQGQIVKLQGVKLALTTDKPLSSHSPRQGTGAWTPNSPSKARSGESV